MTKKNDALKWLEKQSETGNPKEDFVIKAALEILKTRPSFEVDQEIIKDFKKKDCFDFFRGIVGVKQMLVKENLLIMRIRKSFDLKDEVMNVVIFYVLYAKHINFSEYNIKSVAKQMSEKGINTAELAIKFTGIDDKDFLCWEGYVKKNNKVEKMVEEALKEEAEE